MNRSPFLNLAGILLLLTFLLVPLDVSRADTNATPAEAEQSVPAEQEISDTLRAYLQLQGQLFEAQQAIERTRRQAEEAAAKHEAVMTSTDALALQLKDVEHRLTQQRARDTRLTVITVSAFAAICFLAVIVTSYLQWRVVSRVVQWPASLPSARPFEAPVPVAAIGTGTDALVSSVNIEQPNLRLLGAIERLEKRIIELEESARTPLPNPVMPGNGERGNGHAPAGSEPPPALEPDGDDDSGQLDELLAKGQALLNEDKAEAALVMLDEALRLAPQNSEALVRKGAALEKLRKLPEAIECYDQAIAADSSMTIAYLYKGGLFNRLERFSEAVECYEKALRTQEKKSS